MLESARRVEGLKNESLDLMHSNLLIMCPGPYTKPAAVPTCLTVCVHVRIISNHTVLVGILLLLSTKSVVHQRVRGVDHRGVNQSHMSIKTTPMIDAHDANAHFIIQWG